LTQGCPEYEGGLSGTRRKEKVTELHAARSHFVSFPLKKLKKKSFQFVSSSKK
jgi:hypothetical protein